MTAKELKHKLRSLKQRPSFSRPQIIIFILAFGIIGFFLIKSFAAGPVIASLEAEQMSLPAGGSVVNDSTASGGKAVQLIVNGMATGSVNFSSSVTSLTVMARAAQCFGSPAMTVAIDGVTVLSAVSLGSTSWTAYNATVSLNSGSHVLSIAASNLGAISHGSKKSCSRTAYLDVTNFYGPTVVTPPPTVAFSVSPISVTAGQAATLTWSSTNTTTCTASGAWSGTEPTSGSVSTGALNQTSTYSLTCIGSGGTINSSATVTVTGVVTGIQIPTSIASNCSVDVTSALLTWINSVPNNSTLAFGSGKCYRIEGTVGLSGRSGLDFEGNGSSFKSFNAMTSGNYADDQRAMFRMVGSSSLIFHNMTIVGAYTHGGMLDSTIQHAHGIDLRGTSAEVSSVNISNVAGDCVYFGLGYDNTTRSSGSYHDSACVSIGRNAVSFVAANNATAQHLTTDKIGYTAFDVEPNSGYNNGTQNITANDNTIGSYYLYAYSVIESAPNVGEYFTNNTIDSPKGLLVGVVNPGGTASRPNNVNITGNVASVAAASPAVIAVNTDILNVTGNTISLLSGTMATVNGSCKVNVSGNSYPGGSNQVTVTNPVTSC